MTTRARIEAKLDERFAILLDAFDELTRQLTKLTARTGEAAAAVERFTTAYNDETDQETKT